MVQFIFTSIAVFLIIILLLVTILLIAKRYLSPSGNVSININDKTTISVPQGASLMSTLTEMVYTFRLPVVESQAADNAGFRCLKEVGKFLIQKNHTLHVSK